MNISISINGYIYLFESMKIFKIIHKFSNIDELEKFARERYFMKKENEEIYIIEYADSLKTTN